MARMGFFDLSDRYASLSDHSIVPVEDIKVTEIRATDLLDAFAQTPRLAAAVLWAASRDGGRGGRASGGPGTSKRGRTHGTFPVELAARLSLVGVGSKAGFACPLTQYHLADALGLSAVHVTRVLRQLREAGLVTFRDGFVAFDDHDGLADFAQFDPT